LITLATAAITAYLQSIPIGGSALVAELYALVMGIAGIANYVPSLPAVESTTSTTAQKIMPGTITITGPA
jgi:hypothetical protein